MWSWVWWCGYGAVGVGACTRLTGAVGCVECCRGAANVIVRACCAARTLASPTTCLFTTTHTHPLHHRYVWLAANSSFKTDSDLAKYEKARKLKQFIGNIRRKYESDWDATSSAQRQVRAIGVQGVLRVWGMDDT